MVWVEDEQVGDNYLMMMVMMVTERAVRLDAAIESSLDVLHQTTTMVHRRLRPRYPSLEYSSSRGACRRIGHDVTDGPTPYNRAVSLRKALTPQRHRCSGIDKVVM